MPDRSNAERRRLAYLLGISLSLSAACATTTSGLRAGEQAETAKNFDLAVVEYTKAVRANPHDDTARLALDRAKLRASQEHAFRARTLAASERYEEALVEYQLASELNPTNQSIQEEMRTARAQIRAKIAISENSTARPQPASRAGISPALASTIAAITKVRIRTSEAAAM